MNRGLLLVLAAAAGAGIGAAAPDAFVSGVPAAAALSAGDVLGVYVVKFKGDGWSARSTAKVGTANGYRSERIVGAGRIEVVARDAAVNDGLVTVRILLDEATRTGLLGAATSGTPAFEGTAAIVGTSVSLIDSGQPNYVNALVLRFDGQGRKVAGNWMAVYPALEPDLATQKFATGVTVTVNGRRTLRDAAVGTGR